MKRKSISIISIIILCICLYPLIGNTSYEKMESFYMDNLHIQSYKGQLGKWNTHSSGSVYSLARKMGSSMDEVRKINNGSTRGLIFIPMGLKYYHNEINKGHGRRKLEVDTRQLSWPLEKVYYTSRYGPRSGTLHTGLDIACGLGTPILAADDGVISHSGNFGALGRAIAIFHKSGIRTWYGHNSILLLKQGEKVKRGQIIALSGNTGRSTGPHLHFEVRYMDVVMNPEDFLVPSYTRPNLVQLEDSPIEITEQTTFTTTNNQNAH